MNYDDFLNAALGDARRRVLDSFFACSPCWALGARRGIDRCARAGWLDLCGHLSSARLRLHADALAMSSRRGLVDFDIDELRLRRSYLESTGVVWSISWICELISVVLESHGMRRIVAPSQLAYQAAHLIVG